MTGVALGAFGAHGLKESLHAASDSVETWKTGVFYHLLHTAVMYGIARRGDSLRAWWLFGLGVLCFSFSLYGLALWQWKWLGPVTPVGGVLLIAGWAALMIQKTARVPSSGGITNPSRAQQGAQLDDSA